MADEVDQAIELLDKKFTELSAAEERIRSEIDGLRTRLKGELAEARKERQNVEFALRKLRGEPVGHSRNNGSGSNGSEPSGPLSITDSTRSMAEAALGKFNGNEFIPRQFADVAGLGISAADRALRVFREEGKVVMVGMKYPTDRAPNAQGGRKAKHYKVV